MIHHKLIVFEIEMIQILVKNFSVIKFDKFCKLEQYNAYRALHFVPHCLLEIIYIIRIYNI